LKDYAPDHGRSDWERLETILSANVKSKFGQEHAFNQIDSIEAYRASVSVRDYQGLEPWILPSLQGEHGVLTTEAIVAFERTSGSTGEGKWIPYTERLRMDFASALNDWLAGVARHFPEALAGKAYWALSPRFDTSPTLSHGACIESDGDYFPQDVGQALMDWLVMPSSVNQEDSVNHFFERTLDALLAEPELSFISVWSPTFFLELDHRLKQRGLEYTSWKNIWPKLAFISCWADAGSARWLTMVRERSGVFIEPKGLLSTEGVISIPGGASRVPRLFRGGHFIEFVCSKSGRVFCRDELVVGTVYSIVLTTSGGLYRYQTGDLVEVTGIPESDAIEVRFMGREGIVSDLVGEKLDERFVANVFRLAEVSGFLAVSEGLNEYTLWLPNSDSGQQVIERLRENVYMAQALDLGQLRPIRVRPLADGWEGRYVNHIAGLQGCRVGDVKLPILLANPLSEELAQCLTT